MKLTPSLQEKLLRLVAGGRIHHQSRLALERRGLLGEDGSVTKAGRARAAELRAAQESRWESRPPRSKGTYSERALTYATSVVEGKYPASRLTRLACERHLLDLEREGDEDFPYRFDVEAAARVCRFVELLPHTKGRWARNHERIQLEDWQCFITCVVFGWLRKGDGLRRYRRVYIDVSRKNGKSCWTAAIALYMLCADGEHGAEVYSGAGTEKQAWEVFGPARRMAQLTADLRKAYGLEVNARNLHIHRTASKLEPIIGKPGDGASPSNAIHDEYHEHPTEEQYDTMLTGMGAREQPISWVITTAGSDTSGPCYALRSEVAGVLEGSILNEELFGIIYTIDEGDDWTSEEALRKANPNFNVSVAGEFLRSQQRDAVNDPRKQSTFKMKHLCVWVTAAAPYFNLEKWNRLADADLDPAQFEGEACYVGLDLASKLDLSATTKVFRREIENEDHFYTFGRFYLPEERAQEPDKRHYAGWAEAGHVITTPGNITDYDRIEEEILGDAELFRIIQLGVDPYNATQISTHLVSAGIEVVEVPQTVQYLSEPMKWVGALIEDGRLHHDDNPAMAWMIGNVTAQIDRNDNVFPRKERAENKIDGVVALIIALGRALSDDDTESVYGDRGLLFVG